MHSFEPATCRRPARRPQKAPVLNEGEEGYIRRKARSVIGVAGITDADCDDVEQELRLRLWLALATYDATRSRPSYAKTIVNRGIATLLEQRRTAKRGCGKSPQAFDPVVLAECIKVASTIDQVDVRHDLAASIDGLDPVLRRLAQLLKHKSLSSAARELDMPLSTARRRVKSIRERFERDDLRDYL